LNQSEDKILDPESVLQDITIETRVRPSSFEEYLGQKSLKEKLQLFIMAAKKRGESLDHCLFHGHPGLGKTTLASIIANEMCVNIKSTSGPVLEKAGDLAALLTNLEPGDVLFIDEIHRLNAAVEEILYPAMEDYQLDIIIGQGPSARAIKIDIPKFTLVGATTRAGLLTPPLRDRFGVMLRLDFYKPDELKLIVKRSAKILGISIDEEGALEIARRSRGTPRIANRILRRVRDYAEIKADGLINRDVADKALLLLGVDNRGFDSMDRLIIKSIIEKFDGGPVGLETIAAVVSEEGDTIEEVYEPYLIQEGFLKRTPRGRVVTSLAYEHLNMTPKTDCG